MKKLRAKRNDAICLCISLLNNGEKTIDELTNEIFENTNCDTKGRTYEIITVFLSKGMVIPSVKNNKLYWRINIKSNQ